MRVMGIILIVLGVLALLYGGFSYISEDKVAQVGPVAVTAERERVVWIPPVVGAIALVGGILLTLGGGRRESVV